jgi:hypothetical protein
LKRFEEPTNFGCAGLFLVILLIILCEKCSSCSVQPDKKVEIQPTRISGYKPKSTATPRIEYSQSDFFFKFVKNEKLSLSLCLQNNILVQRENVTDRTEGLE